MMPSLKDLRGSNGGTLPAYAWPGGYPIMYIDKDGESLCAECADKEEKPVTYYVNYEGATEQCAECGKDLPSAYGDPEEDKTNDMGEWPQDRPESKPGGDDL